MNRLLLLLFGGLTGLVNGFFGGGGGMIIVPVLLLLKKLPVKKAHATAILVILPVCLVSAFFYFSVEGFDLLTTLNVGLGVIAGGLLGSLLLKKASNKLITVMFAAVMAAAGVKMLFFP